MPPLAGWYLPESRNGSASCSILSTQWSIRQCGCATDPWGDQNALLHASSTHELAWICGRVSEEGSAASYSNRRGTLEANRSNQELEEHIKNFKRRLLLKFTSFHSPPESFKNAFKGLPAWLGLVRNSETKTAACENSTCDGLFTWLDGGKFSYSATGAEGVKFGAKTNCGRLTAKDNSRNIKGLLCQRSVVMENGRNVTGICQWEFDCRKSWLGLILTHFGR